MTTLIKNQRAVVMGLGRFGGGLAVANWLHQQGAEVLVTDLASADDLAEPLSKLHPEIETKLGKHHPADFAVADIVVVNPAVPKPWRNELLRTAQDHAALVTSEIELLVERLPSRERTIGVTGSAGKSTTASLITEGLRAIGETVHLGGNIGGSLLPELENIKPTDRVVLELSSAQLWWLARSNWSPAIAVVTNLTPNHLDWHNDFAHYEKAKQQIVKDQLDTDIAVLPDELAHWKPVRAPLVSAHTPLSLAGAHNQQNAKIALSAIAAGAGQDKLMRAAQAIAKFRGLPHRLQNLGELNHIKFINDSKSTTPESTLLAVAAVADPSRTHLIAGGYDKGIDLSPISNLADQLAGLYTIGTTAPKIGGTICTDLDSALAAATAAATPGDTILLSPGCASWDQFRDFTQRGDRFTKWVENHRGAAQGVDSTFGIR